MIGIGDLNQSGFSDAQSSNLAYHGLDLFPHSWFEWPVVVENGQTKLPMDEGAQLLKTARQSDGFKGAGTYRCQSRLRSLEQFGQPDSSRSFLTRVPKVSRQLEAIDGAQD